MILPFTTRLNGLCAAAVLAAGLAGAAPAAALGYGGLAADPGANPRGLSTGGTAIGTDASDIFDTRHFPSSRPVFEFAGIKVSDPPQVPVPAAGLMLLTAAGGFAMLRRRKRSGVPGSGGGMPGISSLLRLS